MVTSGSMSAGGKRGRWQLERDTDPKGPVNDWGSPSLDSYRARLRLYPNVAEMIGSCLGSLASVGPVSG